MKHKTQIDIISALALVLSIAAMIFALMAYNVVRKSEQELRKGLTKKEVPQNVRKKSLPIQSEKDIRLIKDTIESIRKKSY